VNGRAGRFGWVLFDWACQPWFTLVTTFVFGPYVASTLAADPVTGQALWGYAASAAGLVVALAAPVVGVAGDRMGRRKPLILALCAVMMLASFALWFAAPGASHALTLALAAFAIGTIAAELAGVLANAMLPGLASPGRIGRLSGQGWAAGYAGGLVSLVVVLGFLAADPATGKTLLGLPSLLPFAPEERAGDRAAGPLTALWFLIFALPFLLFTPDRAVPAAGASLSDGLRLLWRHLKGEGRLRRFLLGHMAAQDGLAALFAFGGIYGAGVFGWRTIELGLFGILLTITGTAGALLGGALDDRLGARRVLMLALGVLIAACLVILSTGAGHVAFVVSVTPPAPGDGLFASAPERVFLLAGAFIGAAAGPLQASARTLMAGLAPSGEVGAHFGLLALSGKATAFAGPLLVAVATQASGRQEAAVAVILALFVVAALLFARVESLRR
jgi:UMF1 family MFS transporter